MMIRSLCFCGMGETVARSYPSPLWGGSARSAGVGVAHGSARTIPLLRQPAPDRPLVGQLPTRGEGMSKRWQGRQSHVKVCIFREDHPWQTKMPARFANDSRRRKSNCG